MADSWDQLDQQLITGLGALRVNLTAPSDDPGEASAKYCADVLVGDGVEGMEVHGDLTPYLTSAQQTALWQVVSAVRSKMEDEMLP